MKNPNFERCVFVLKLNPFELGTIVFFSSFHTSVILLQIDPVSSDQPYTVCEICYEIEILLFSHGLQFSMLDTIVDYEVRFVDYFLIARWTT